MISHGIWKEWDEWYNIWYKIILTGKQWHPSCTNKSEGDSVWVFTKIRCDKKKYLHMK